MTVKEKDRKLLHDLHEKYYGKKKKVNLIGMVKEKKEEVKIVTPVAGVKKAVGVVTPVGPSPKEGVILAAGSSRNEMMKEAQRRGVKNFRVLNKLELTDILANIGDQKKVDAVVAGAVERWKPGWGSKKAKK